MERLWSIAVGLSSGIGSSPPDALCDARWLSDVLSRLTLENTFLKYDLMQGSSIEIESVSSKIERRWDIQLAKRIGEDVVAGTEPQPGTGLPEATSSDPEPVEPRVPESAAPSVETRPQHKRPRLSEPE